MNIAILSASVRTGRNSHRVALFFKNYIEENKLATVTLIDLKEYDFPIFHERLRNLENPPENLLDYTEKIKAADGVLIVTPEYNGGYPAALKNATDVLYVEWNRKPVAISTVSEGNFGGSQVITSFQFSMWKMHALTVPAMFPVPNVESAYNEDGTPTDKEGTNKRAGKFLKELLWYMKAKKLADENMEN